MRQLHASRVTAGIDPEIMREVRAAWPTIHVDRERFNEFVAQKAEGSPLESLRLSDLYLVCACLDRISGAAEELERSHFDTVRQQIRRFRHRGESEDELAQRIRVKLLLGAEGAPPALSSFQGTGSLRGWLRILTSRILIDLFRQESLTTCGPEELANRCSETLNVERALLKQRHGAVVRQAMERAVQELAADEASMLRLLLEGMNLNAAGQRLGISRRTSYRLYDRMQHSLLSRFKSNLQESLHVPLSEIDSLMRELRSQAVEHCAAIVLR